MKLRSLALLFMVGVSGRALAQQRTVFVSPVKALGVPKSVSDALAGKMAATLASHPELKVVSNEEMRDLLGLDRMKQLAGCEADEQCVAEISSKAKADLIVQATVGRIQKSFVLSMSLIDAKASTTLERASETVGQEDKLMEAVPGVLGALFRWKGVVTGPKYKLPQGQKLKFAVLDLKPTGVEKDVARNLTQLLSVEIKRIENTSVISRDDLTAIIGLDRLQQLGGMECDESCAAELGGALGVDKLVSGQVGKLGDSFVVSLRLIDPNTVKVDNRVTETFRGRQEELLRAVPHAGRQLLGIDVKDPGSLVVTASEEEAIVFVNNKERGALPLPPIGDLPVGRHSLRVVRDGYYEWQGDTYIEPRSTTAVWAELQAKPTPWYKTWWFWTIIGGAVVAGGTTAAVVAAQSDTPLGTGVVTISSGP